MTKSNYALNTNVQIFYKDIESSVSDDLLQLALDNADIWVEGEIPSQDKVSTPKLVQQAAEFYAAALILRQLYTTENGTNPTADSYERKAQNALDKFVVGGDAEGDEPTFTAVGINL